MQSYVNFPISNSIDNNNYNYNSNNDTDNDNNSNNNNNNNKNNNKGCTIISQYFPSSHTEEGNDKLFQITVQSPL